MKWLPQGKENKINTIIGYDVQIKGNVSTQQTIRVDGQIEGDIVSEQEVIVGSSGQVRGNISAKKVINHGTIWGNVVAEESIEMTKKAVLMGDIKTRALNIVPGSVFRGKSEMLIDKDTDEILSLSQKQNSEE